MANDLSITLADRFLTTGGETAAEVVAYDGFRYYTTNAAASRIDVFRAGVGLVGALDLADLPGYAGVTSVAAKNGLVAVAIDGGDVAGIPLKGHVALFQADTGALLNYVQVGFLPDSLTFSADGLEIYVANEGEPESRGDAPGSVSIVTFPDGVDQLATVTDIGFAAFDGQQDALRAMGVRLFPGRAPSRDFEPEYVSVDPADGAILVSLQEANAVARIDRATLEVTLLPQGTLNHAELGAGIDASDSDDAIRIANWPVRGLRMADSIATFSIGGETYYATANEGDSRGTDESRVRDLALDPTAFPLADALQLDNNLGRLIVSNIDGDVDGDGDFDQLFAFGSRSFTIYNAAGEVVFDSADQFERIIAAVAPDRFNSDADDGEENRSDNKGPEPEAIAVGAVDGRMIAVIGLERDGGLMVYDVTDPANATFLTYVDSGAGGDVSPEVVAFIPGARSPSGFAQIAVAYEVSGTTAVYDLTFTGEPVGEGEPDTDVTDFDLRITEIWPGNEPGDDLTADWFEITNFGTEAWVQGVDPTLFYDDDSSDPSTADAISGIATIRPGESVIVLVDGLDAVAAFIETWGSVVDLSDVAIGATDGAGLGQGGDAVSLFVGGPSVATLVDFEDYPDANATGGRSWNVIAGAFSTEGDGFGSVATDAVNDADQPAIGSPGFAIDTDVPATFTLELLHFTDQEGRSDAPFDAPRLSAVLNALRAQDLGDDGLADNTLTLSSGDAWIPGLFYSASRTVFGLDGVGDILIQNALGVQAIAFGNHEFDQGTAAVAALLRGASLNYDIAGVPDFTGAAFPYLSTNLDFSTDANLAPLVVPGGGAPLPNTISSSVVMQSGGELIGVVGATTPTLRAISSPGGVTVNPQPFDGAPTPEQIDALAALIQAEVDALLAANPTMNKVILLAHMQQIGIELALAERLVNVDVIVAGGSNTRLFDDNDRPRDGDSDQGQYPLFIDNAGGTQTAVVNTDGSYKYVGRLVIDFDENGDIIADSYDDEVSGAYATDEQGVADLGAAGMADPVVQAVADALGAQILGTEGNVFGVSDVFLNGVRAEVRSQETNFGNLTADANLAFAKTIDAATVISIKNGGGVRDDIGEIVVPAGGVAFVRVPNEAILDADGNVVKPAGGISQNDIGNALSFNNGLSLLTLTTAELATILEHGVGASTYDAAGVSNAQGRFPQIAGMKFSFDPDLPAGERILNAGIFAEDGALIAEIVRDGDIVDNGDATFRVVTLGFLAGGGDGYPFPQGAGANRVDLNSDSGADRTGAATFAADGSEQDVLAEYLLANFLSEPFAEADTLIGEDTRIQNLNFRADAVFADVSEPDFLVINEIVVSTSGTDTEFLELLGDPMLSLDGVFLLEVTSGGVIDTVLNFSGAALGENGYFLAASPTAEANLAVTADFDIADNTFTNVSQTYLLVRGFTGARGADIDADNDGVIDAAAWDAVIDSVAVIGADNPVIYSDNVVGPDGGFLAAGGFRDPEGTGDFTMHGFSNFAGFTPTSGADDNGGGADLTLISDIQGAGAATALAGQRVKVQAVVTLLSNQLNGFFLQEEAADSDGDAATSEGIFVFTGGDPTVSVGDVVAFEATVSEFFTLTQLSGLGTIDVIARGAALPASVAFTLPLPDATDPAAFYESLEGMLVRATAAPGETLRVTDAFTSNGEVGVTAGDPLVQPTQAFKSFTPEAAALDAANARNILVFENPVDDSLTSAPRVGDGIVGGAIEGALTFTFGEFKVETLAPVAFDAAANPNPRQDAPADVGGRLKVASFNVLNYFTTLGSRGAATEAELAAQTAKIVAAITAINADVLGLIEIENDLSGVADEAVIALVDAINAELGSEVYDYIATGAVGTDQIKQAILYKIGAVTPTGDFAVLDDEAFTAPFTPGSPQSRPALAQTFAETATGEVFTVSVNHFKSKGSTTGAVVNGEADDSPVEGSAALTRVAAAQALAAWIASDPTGSGDADHLTIGDFNAYAMERAIRALEAAGLTNLNGSDDVSYSFNGEGGTLDYAFASESLLSQITGATIWNANSPEAYSTQYDGRDFAAFGDLSPFASSDHDPVIVGLNLDEDDATTLTIIASGTGDATRTPKFRVLVDGVSLGVQSFEEVQTNAEQLADGRAYESFVFNLESAPVESVDIVFFNDRSARDGLEDVNLFVDAIEIGGRRFEAEEEGFFTVAPARRGDVVDGPREDLYWNGVLRFDELSFA